MIACSDVKYPTAQDVYAVTRAANNELGKLLKEYHDDTLKLAQRDVDAKRASTCTASDEFCRESVKQYVLKQYEDREASYNTFVTIQITVGNLAKYADKICAESEDVMCDEAKQDVINKRNEISAAWKQLSNWMK